MKVTLLTGGGDTPYALGMLSALVGRKIHVDFISNDEMSGAPIVSDEYVNNLNLRGDQSTGAPGITKALRVARYYLRLLKYAVGTDSGIFHILWLNKFILFDRTLLLLYYKALGKKIVFTAHNINERQRDGGDTFANRLSLKIMYSAVDHIFVHTSKMKSELIGEFGIPGDKVTVIPFGINETIPATGLGKEAARKRLGLCASDKVLLFFGNIAPYKGLEHLLMALEKLLKSGDAFKLIMAGQVKDCASYWEEIERLIKRLGLEKNVMKLIKYIPDGDVEGIFKASDVLVLPYKFIYQSGVLFLSYNFGLPVIATDVGSLRDDIVEGRTGLICEAGNLEDLAEKIGRFFLSDMYKNPEDCRKYITAYCKERHSWDEVAVRTRDVYSSLSRV